MTQNRKWLLLPPAVALLIVLGPLSMRNETAAAERSTQDPAPSASTKTAVKDDRVGPALPRTPDLWQVGSTLIGVLVLGGVGVAVMRRLRQGPTATGSGAVSLRQSLRLSPRQVVHAIEFEGRLLLVGEGERGLQLLHANTPPTPAEDEAAIAARHREPDDDGAVPKDLVLPRPPRRTAAPAANANNAVATLAAALQSTARASANAPKTALGDFRALLAKVGR